MANETRSSELYGFADQHVTGFLGVLRDRSVVYLATVQSEGPIAITHRPGSQAHLHSTAMGKALLAEMTDDRVSKLLGETPLPRLTSRTKVSLGRAAKHPPCRLCDQRRREPTGFLLPLARWCEMRAPGQLASSVAPFRRRS